MFRLFAKTGRQASTSANIPILAYQSGQSTKCSTLVLKATSRRNHTSSLLNRVLANSVCIADKSAKICRDVMASGQLDIVEKTGSDDLQTRADRSVQDCIVESLKTNFPGLTVIGEEGDEVRTVKDDWLVREQDEEALKLQIPEEFSSASLEELTVWVDPLDGTKEFTEGLVEYVTILIGIAVGKQAVAGVINQPYFKGNTCGKVGRTIYGVVGSDVKGAKRALPPQDKRIVTITRARETGLIRDCAQACSPTEIIRVGGAGHKVMLLIEGRAHAYIFPSPGCKRWDTCAPEAILTAMGGKLTDIWGNKYDYDKNVSPRVNEWGILATCEAERHNEYLNMIPDNLKEQVKDCFKKK